MFSNNDIDKTRNKVYINPNFNRTSVNNYPIHVNPRFPSVLPSVQPNVHNKNRIHVNPNFMKAKVSNVENTSIVSIEPNVVSNDPSHEKMKIDSWTFSDSVPVRNSRYCLVRHNTNTVFEESQPNKDKSAHLNKYKPPKDIKLINTKIALNKQAANIAPQSQILEQTPKTTYQLNKYKSVPLKDIKIMLDNTKTILNKQSTVPVSQSVLEKSVPCKHKTTFQLNKYKSLPIKDIKRKLDNNNKVVLNKQIVVASQPKLPNYPQPCNSNYSLGNITKRTQFKLVHTNNSKMANGKISRRSFIDINKKILINQPKLSKIKGNFKKNNIPCPMFRKFGRCLRKEHGRCDFLHDRKHVSICRKFIKGLCHDNDCLLSHDLTTKKMPTCYFYLQGTCTKSDCPYLHVKLNEKVKVCSDFLKGYCEKGSKCLQQHTNLHTRKDLMDSSIRLRTSLSSQKKYTKVKVKILDRMSSSVTCSMKTSARIEKNETNLDRYYQEEKKGDEITTETYEIIRPSRCKLGTLPSFIQL